MAESYRPTKGMQDAAKRALAWIADGKAGSGFTDVGRKRASDIAAGRGLSAETVIRMYSFFARHEVDKKATGFNSGEDGFPTPGRVAWDAWGGDPGFSWSTKIRNQLQKSARSLEMMESEEDDMAESTTIADLKEELTELLADKVSFYFRAHGAHWNVIGTDFAEYHELFSKIYEDVYHSVDPLAEILRKLGQRAPFRLSEFIELRTIDDSTMDSQDARVLATDLLAANDLIIEAIAYAFECADELNQQGIANFLAERLDSHQNWKWQLSASLGIEASAMDLEVEPAEEIGEYPMPEEPVSNESMVMRKATGAANLPLADRARPWDAAAANKRVQDYAGGADNLDFAKYEKAFFYVDAENKELLGSYKLQFADVIDGELTAIPRGIFAVAAVLQGGRGGVDIPQADQDAIKSKVAAYYDRMASEFDDDSIVAPFENRAAADSLSTGDFVAWGSSGGRARGKIEKIVKDGTAKSSEGYSIEGTSDDPAFIIRIYSQTDGEWKPTDMTVVHRADSLTVINDLRSQDTQLIEARKSAMATAERMTMNAEIRAMDTEDGSMRIGGYAATFNNEATGLNFREVIAPGAFTNALTNANEDPIFLLINHDADGIPLASTKSGTLRLMQDDIGLRMEADLDPSNPKAQELASAIRRGDMTKMSFAFTVNADGQTKEEGLRTLTSFDKIYEVSAVTWPAYDSTDLGMRSKQQEEIDLRVRKLKAQMTQLRLRK